MKKDFYWTGIDENEAEKGKEVIVNRSGNTLTIESCDYSRLVFHLDDKVADLDKPVTVIFGGNVLFEGMVTRSPAVMRKSLREREDPGYIFCSELTVNL